MTDKEFKKEIKSLSGGYLLYGDEEYLKNYYLDLAAKEVIGDNTDFEEFNLIKISADNFSVSSVEDGISTFPMMSEKVCVVCKVRLSKLSEKEVEAFCELLERLENYPAVLLVFAHGAYFDAGNVKKNRPSALYKKLTKVLKPVEFTHQPPAMLKKWVFRHLEVENLTCDEAVLTTLCEMCDYDMSALAAECEKLVCYAKSKDRDRVEVSDVKLLCSEYGESGAFALTNAIVTGDKPLALRVLKEYKDKRRSAVSVLASIISDFSNMLTVSVYMQSGMYKGEIAKKTGLHEFRVGRYMESVEGLDTAVVAAALERCRGADAALKSSSVDYIALERLVCTMPARRQNRSF